MFKKGKDKNESGGTSSEKPGVDMSAQNGEQPTAQRLPMVIHAQFIKDLSFENPNAPMSLHANPDKKSSMDVNFSMDAQKSNFFGDRDDTYEVTLGIQVQAKRGDQVACIVEIEYGVVVTLDNIAEEKIHPMLFIEVPRYMFPFARHIIANVTQQGGYSPILLAPVDFRDFYLQRYSKNEESAEKVA